MDSQSSQTAIPTSQPVFLSLKVVAELKPVEKHGGKAMGEKQEVPNMGWSAYFWDPEGNLMGLFQSTRPM